MRWVGVSIPLVNPMVLADAWQRLLAVECCCGRCYGHGPGLNKSSEICRGRLDGHVLPPLGRWDVDNVGVKVGRASDVSKPSRFQRTISPRVGSGCNGCIFHTKAKAAAQFTRHQEQLRLSLSPGLSISWLDVVDKTSSSVP